MHAYVAYMAERVIVGPGGESPSGERRKIGNFFDKVQVEITIGPSGDQVGPSGDQVGSSGDQYKN